MNPFKKINKLFIYGSLIAIFVAFLDLLSKRLIFAYLEDIALTKNTLNPEIEIFSFFNIVYVWNRGVSFGMFNGIANAQLVLSILQGSIAVILFFWLYHNKNSNYMIAISLIIGGALGNVIDRIQNGAVADFLDFYIGNYHWPAFNLADSFIFL